MKENWLAFWGAIVTFGAFGAVASAQVSNVQLTVSLEERVSPTDSYIRLTLFAPAPSPSPFSPRIDVYAPSMLDSLALDSVGNWTGDFASFEEANQFLSGDWSVRYTKPGFSPPFQDHVENYRLTVDPLVLPPNARPLGEIVLPLEGQEVQEGDWFDVAWDFPAGTPPGTINIFTDVEPPGKKVEWNLALWGQSGQGTRRRGPNPMGQVVQREHRFHLNDDELFDLELRFLTEGYDLPIPIGLSAGSYTYLGEFNGLLVDGPLPGELNVSMIVNYTFHPDPTTYVYLVAAPLLGDYNEDGVVDAGDYIVWRNNFGSDMALPNDDTPGVDIDDYTRWKRQFGQTAGASLEATVRPIPEPRTMALAGLLVASVVGTLGKKPARWRIAPLVFAPLGRVALEDEVAEAQQARVALILVGERAGLSSPDSLGAYLVHAPKVGNTDATRNCVSNIRPEGLSHAAASELLAYLLGESRRRGVSGVGLKDERRGMLASE